MKKLCSLMVLLGLMAVNYAAISEYAVMQERTILITPAYQIVYDENSSTQNLVAGESFTTKVNISHLGSKTNNRTVDFDILGNENIYVSYDDLNQQDILFPEIVFDDDAAHVLSSSGPNYGYEYPWYAYSCTNKTTDASHAYDYVRCTAALVEFSGLQNKTAMFTFETNELTSMTSITTRVSVK